MSLFRRDKRLQGVNNGIRALIPGLRSGSVKREFRLEEYVDEALLCCQQVGESFGSTRKQKAALRTAVQALVNGGILRWNNATEKVYVPDETEVLFEQVPDRYTGDSSAAAYVAHAKSLRGLFSLPIKVKTKHQLQWDNIELGCEIAGLRREKDSFHEERDTVRQQYDTLCAERDTLQKRCSELEKERERLMNAFDAQETEDRQLQPAAEDPACDEQQGERSVVEEREWSPQPLAYGSRGRASANFDPFTGFGNRIPATPFTPARRPAYRLAWAAVPPSSHNKMRKAQSMPCSTKPRGYYGDQNHFAPPTPVSNPHPFGRINFEVIQEEPPSPTVEHVRPPTVAHVRRAPLERFANDAPVLVVGKPRDLDAMDEDEDAPLPELKPEPQSSTSLFDKGKNALYQLATVVTSPMRLLSGGRGVEEQAHHTEEPAFMDTTSRPAAEAMTVDYEPSEEGSESVLNLREYTPSVGFTPPVTPSRRHSPFSLRGTQRDRRNQQLGELQAEIAELKEELRDAMRYRTNKDIYVEELEWVLREKQALLEKLVRGHRGYAYQPGGILAQY